MEGLRHAPLFVGAWVLVVCLILLSCTASALGEDSPIADPPRPVTPSQFTSIVVIGLNANSPFLLGLHDDELTSNEAVPMLPMGSGRHWAAMYDLQRKAGVPLSSPLSASKLHAALPPSNSNWQYLAGQYYYNAESQKIRIDSTIPGGFISSYSYFAYGSEWIYTFSNTDSPTCKKYALDKTSFPDTNWLQNAQYVGTAEVLGIPTYHWHGKGNHLGPDVGLNVYDYYVSVNDSSPVLISNAGFVQYFMTFNKVNMSQQLWNYPAVCNL